MRRDLMVDMVTDAKVGVHKDDLDEAFLQACLAADKVAWDIETSGLNWREDSIGTCQVAVGPEIAVIQLSGWGPPPRLSALLEAPDVRKIFHHAPFDLRFMAYQWNVQPANIACTKIASKILDPHLPSSDHSLKPVLLRHLGVAISKEQQQSDWMARDLLGAQIRYAATDVEYLERLLDTLSEKAAKAGCSDLLDQSFQYLPTRVELDLRGIGDVFNY
jgi:ribonuclease D